MKRILVLNYEFPPLGGGAGNATYYLLREFSKYPDLEINLVTSSKDKSSIENFFHNTKIYHLNIGKNNKNLHYQSIINLLRYSWKAYWCCKKLTKTKKYNLIHAFFGIPCGYLAMKLNLPYIVSLRGSDVPFYNPRFKKIDKLIFKRLSRRIWQRASAVITNSQGLKELAQQTAPQQKIDVIYNGVDINEFKPLEKNNNDFIILSTSRFIKRKGIEYLIEGFAKFQKNKPDTKLILIGSGNLEKYLKEEVNRLNIFEKVEFKGTVKHDKIVREYQRADVFALPSLNEGMSNSLLEAMASGLAIIATDTGGTRELVDKTNGIIINKKNSEDIDKALEKIYSNLEFLNFLKSNSRSKAEKLDWGKVVSQYVTYYKNV